MFADFTVSGLSHEACLQKMRMLTLMSIAETQTEISFDKLCREMKLNEDDVERFILEGKETHKPVVIYENGVYFCLTYIFICQTSGLLPSSQWEG